MSIERINKDPHNKVKAPLPERHLFECSAKGRLRDTHEIEDLAWDAKTGKLKDEQNKM